MNKTERIKMVRAMEFIARHVNDETQFEPWLIYGVADGDIDYGATNVETDDELALGCYIDDDEDFAGLMDLFLRIMNNARIDGGLYCDKVVSK